MINVMQNEKEYTISVSIPFKKVAFSETPSKRDFKEFAEKVFEAYTNIIVEACASNLIKHSDSIKYCSGGEHTFSFNAYETMRVQQYKLTKSELKQIAKALYWVEDRRDIHSRI